MSRIFAGYAFESYVQTVGSDAQVTAFSFAAWVKTNSNQASGGTIFVKDPANSYKTFLEILSDGTIFAQCGNPYLGGIATAPVAVPGTGYAHLDTGTVLGSNPDIAANRASYAIGGAPGGIPTTPVGIPGSGTGYAVGQTYATLKGGGQPGSGSGLTLLVTAINNQVAALSQSVETVPLNTWTHLAMTWDSAGDGLVRLYINGVECTYQGQRTTSILPDVSTGPYVFGDDLGDFTYDGQITEVAVYGNTALSGAQVAALAASTSGVPVAQLGILTDYWHLCGSNSPEPNVQNPANVGTLSVIVPLQGGNSPGYSLCSGPPSPSAPGDNVVDSLSRCCTRILP